MDPRDRLLSKAKIGLMSRKDSTFISTILLSLRAYWDTTHPTACTDGISLRINPEWFCERMDGEQRIGLLAHEAWHVAFQHMLRVGNRNFPRWNQACDHVINLMLLDQGFRLPDGGLWDRKYKGMSSEQVYDLLAENPDEMDPDFVPDFSEPEEGDQGQDVEQQIADLLVKAATQSKMAGDGAGSIPGEIEIFLDKLLNPKLPWNQILLHYMQGLAPEDYSFRKFNRRFFPDYYLPGLYSEALQEIAVAVDTSGSVTDQQFLMFTSEIHAIQQSLHPQKLTVIDFDTQINTVQSLVPGDTVKDLKFSGRGGTLIDPVLDWAKENQPTALLIFTDGYFRRYLEDPGCPVIWIIHSNPSFTYPFGRVIEYPLEDV